MGGLYPKYEPIPEDQRPEHWKAPEGGPHGVAIESSFYEACADEIDNFFGRRLDKWTHYLSYGGQTFAIFTFKEQADAIAFMTAFEGEPFDRRDRGGGQNWMKWYKGRAAKRDKNRSPYDFRK